MARTKTATAYVDSVTFTCAGCRDNLAEPSSGSHMWTLEDARMWGGSVVGCVCGTDNLIPAKLRPRLADDL